MPTDKPRISFALTEDLLRQVDEFRYSNRVKNQSQAIIQLMEKGLEVIASKPSEKIGTKRIPVIGDIAAGQPIYANREYDEYVEVPDDGKHRYDAALRVVGDSMSPRYQIGDLALVRYQDDVDDGQIAAICIDDTVTLKRVYHFPHGIQLISDNPNYQPMIYTSVDVDNVHLVGLAVGVLHFDY